MDTKQSNWQVLESFKWDHGGNYDREMLRFWTKDVLKDAKKYAIELRRHLADVLGDHAERITGNRYGYWGISDDSFWDLTAHIVGLGENVYHLVLKYPEIAKMMADEQDFTENFEYIFNTVV